ncbi:hypothetical protein ACVWYN_001678 [Pedobacter sp. UYP24]
MIKEIRLVIKPIEHDRCFIKTINKIKRIALLSLLFLIGNVANGQTDSLKVKEYIYNRVYKNITAFYIGYQLDRKKDLNENGFLEQGMDSYFFD